MVNEEFNRNLPLKFPKVPIRTSINLTAQTKTTCRFLQKIPQIILRFKIMKIIKLFRARFSRKKNLFLLKKLIDKNEHSIVLLLLAFRMLLCWIKLFFCINWKTNCYCFVLLKPIASLWEWKLICGKFHFNETFSS